MIVDESFFKKINLWGSIVIGALCLFISVSLATTRSNFFVIVLFLILAVNCAWRVRSYYKIERMRKETFSEEEIALAERRSRIVNSIFSHATLGFFLLLIAVLSLIGNQKGMFYFSALSAALALCFIALFAINLRNLKRFDQR